MKIVLIYPPCSETSLKGYPLGLGYLSSALKGKHEVVVLDYNGKPFGQSIKNCLRRIKEEMPGMVAVSFNSFNRWGAYQLIKNIKKINKDIIVVLGGVHPSIMYAQIFRYFYRFIDFIVQSEGEAPLSRLCEALESHKDYTGISGLIFKSGNGQINLNPSKEFVSDLDSLPMPDYSYARGSIKEKGIGYMITSRGCPVNCVFCSTSSFWGQNVRVNSPQRIAREVEYLKGMGARRIFFHDDTFNLGIERTIKVARALKSLNIEYAIQCRVRPVNEEMIAELADSGCKHISWGVESLSEKMLKAIDKKITPEEVKNAFDICAKFTDKLTTNAYCCVGVPGETEEDIAETASYFNKNIRSTHGPGASILYILPGTRVYNSLIKAGKFDEKIWVKTDSVYYYTKERNVFTLNKWRKQINMSGRKIPYSCTFFWDIKNAGTEEPRPLGRFRRTLNKINRFINFLRNRY